MCASFLGNYKPYEYEFWYTRVEKWNLMSHFFTFIKFLICWVIKWGKRVKMAHYGLWCSLHYIWGTFDFWNTALLTNGIISRLFFKWLRAKVVKWQKVLSPLEVVPHLYHTCVIFAGNYLFFLNIRRYPRFLG